MEAVKQTKAQEVLNHHLSAFLNADLNEMMKDYTEDSELLTPNGPLKGLNSISNFFAEAFKIVPKGSAFEMKQMIIRDDILYLAWSCDSSFVSIPLGTDSFIIENDKILYQTLAAHIIPK